LINIITGLIGPTHGKVFMMGLDVETQSSQVQQIIGVCPQDDILWDDLTAREHMLLVAAFKGVRWGPTLNKVRCFDAMWCGVVWCGVVWCGVV
jgi:ABC-type multidrug transport system ATPase subunit